MIIFMIIILILEFYHINGHHFCAFLFVFSTLEKEKELWFRVFKFFVFHSKSVYTTNNRKEPSDISY